MTAHNLFVAPGECVIMISDTAVYTKDGVITGFRSKSHVDEAGRWGALFTGDSAGCEWFQAVLPAIAGMPFDRALALFPTMLRDYKDLAISRGAADADVSIALGGWSDEAAAWVGATISSDECDGVPAFELRPVGGFMQPHCAIGGQVRAYRQSEIEAGFAAFGIREFGRRMLEAQRQGGVPDHRGVGGLIGGVGEIVVISRAGAHRETLTRWMDAIGDDVAKIKARARRSPPALFPAQPSRAERRRTEREARRAA